MNNLGIITFALICSLLCFSLNSDVLAQGAGTTIGGPDVIVGALPDMNSYGSVGGISAFSVATTSCNIGDTGLEWISSNNRHPVIGQNMYRLKDGVMEQIGMSWLKHGFFALQGSLCSSGAGGCTPGGNGSLLNPGCSDPYGAGLNGSQGNLGPRYQVNTATGFYPYPWSAPSAAPTIGRRLQVRNSDLDPALNPGAMYFVTGHYIAPDDTEAGHDDNNSSYRQATISGSGSSFTANVIGSTVRQRTGVEAWADFVPSVELDYVNVADDGHFIVGSRVIDLGGGLFQYEYAVYNMNSDRSLGSFSVSAPTGLPLMSNGFTKVLTHSGSPYSNNTWNFSQSATDVSWTTDLFAVNANAAAVRWDTMANFRFVTSAPPTTGSATLGLFKPGTAANPVITVPVPNGAFLLPVNSLNCQWNNLNNEVELSWSNGDTYTAIEILRDAVVIANLGGGATSYNDSGYTVGMTHTYSVRAFDGVDSAGDVNCDVMVPLPTLDFTFVAEDTTINFDEITGVGNGSFDLNVIESAGNAGFPNGIDALSMSGSFDNSVVQVTGLTVASGLPFVEFFNAEVFSGGYTVGVIVDLNQVDELFFSTETAVATVAVDTVAAALAGASAQTTPSTLVNGVWGLIPIDNLVVVGVETYSPALDHGIISLNPTAGSAGFRRGDSNGDGGMDISDGISTLAYLFTGGEITCLSAADANDDGSVNIADAVSKLDFLFSGGSAPPAPFGACGVDPTPDTLDCVLYDSCP